MKRKVLKIIFYVAGIFCLVYPVYSKFLSFKNQTRSIYDYKKELAIMKQEDLEDRKKKAEEFNKNTSTETTIIDPTQIGTSNSTTNEYNFLELGETIGFISIPKINLEIPIYEGITTNNLTKGVAHMENTSLPNGGISTHSILAGHTGIPQAEIFDNLDKLEVGDEFYINFYGTVSKYNVINSEVVLPDNTNALKIEQGKSLVTLVTCTPKTVNTHRLIVTGEKVQVSVTPEKDNQIETDIQIEEIAIEKTDFELLVEFLQKNLKMIAIVIIILILLIILHVLNYIRKQKKKSRGE